MSTAVAYAPNRYHRVQMYHMNKKQEANALVIECITTALLKLMEKKSIDEITITDLTKLAGVGRVSFLSI